MGKSLKLKNSMTWSALINDGNDMSIYNSAGWRTAAVLLVQLGVMVFAVPLGFAVHWLFFLLFLPGLLFLFFGQHLPKLHYLDGLGHHSEAAIKWYRSLTKDEQKELPQGWEDVVREHGEEYNTYKRIDSRSFMYSTVAGLMHHKAERVIELYREKNAVPKVPDYRIDVYTQLMTEKAEAYKQDLQDRKEIEDKIARMD
jgi:hypothetical protein